MFKFSLHGQARGNVIPSEAGCVQKADDFFSSKRGKTRHMSQRAHTNSHTAFRHVLHAYQTSSAGSPLSRQVTVLAKVRPRTYPHANASKSHIQHACGGYIALDNAGSIPVLDAMHNRLLAI